MAIRSGRFKAADVSGNKALTIVKGRTEAFRIFNSGASSFTIKPNGGSTPTNQTIKVAEGGSVDVVAAGDVIITHNAVSAVEGIYEYLDAQRPVRSGRFTGDATTPGITIVQNRDGEFYRILNSGDHEFDVEVDGVVKATLKPTYSIDVVAGLKIVIMRDDNSRVEGIYDYLRSQHEIRSGRFKIKSPDDPTNPHPIIDLSGRTDRAWYRIFNSGLHPIIILEGTKVLHTLGIDQSFDFEVGPSARSISVKSDDPEHPIDGIYEFLGRED